MPSLLCAFQTVKSSEKSSFDSLRRKGTLAIVLTLRRARSVCPIVCFCLVCLSCLSVLCLSYLFVFLYLFPDNPSFSRPFLSLLCFSRVFIVPLALWLSPAYSLVSHSPHITLFALPLVSPCHFHSLPPVSSGLQMFSVWKRGVDAFQSQASHAYPPREIKVRSMRLLDHRPGSPQATPINSRHLQMRNLSIFHQ